MTHAADRPTPKPLLLLLPGLLCDGRLWRDQARDLADIVEPVIADLTRDASVEAMARSALAMLDARAGVDRSTPCAVAGLSMGGYVALALLRLAPDRVGRLCLLDTSARPDTPEQERRRRGLMALVRSTPPERFRGVTPRLLAQLVHRDREDDPILAEEIAGMAGRVGRDAFLRQQQAILGRPDSRPTLARLRVPTLVGVGEDDRLTPRPLAEELATAIPGAELKIIEGCGHLPPLERPEAVTSLMRDWLLAGFGRH